MTEDEIVSLLERYELGTCSKQEKRLVEQWIDHRLKTTEWSWKNPDERDAVRRVMLAQLQSRLFPVQRRDLTIVFRRVGIAASIILCLSVALIMLLRQQPSIAVEERFYTEQAVSPGRNVARLTLFDNKTIWLDDVAVGRVYNHNGMQIVKLEDGSVRFEMDASAIGNDIRQNTISIPRGAHYRIILPDSTRVWLNSATTLAFPVTFAGAERKVALSGEAYFEVAKDSNKPFKVNANGTQIAVTGTHFNVMAYTDEQHVVTTLLEGGVDVFKGSSKIKLSPGQQAVTGVSNATAQKNDVDTELATAWIRGNFVFEEQSIQSIMKSIARWYNVEVIFRDPPSQKTFGGTYTRSKPLAELLQHLEALSGMKFKLEERRVLVMK